MKKKSLPLKRHAKGSTHRHHSGEGRCLDILRQLSAYIDDELPSDICTELRRHLGACPNCEDFIESLRQTVTLCRHSQTPHLSAQDRATLRGEILQAAQTRNRQ